MNLQERATPARVDEAFACFGYNIRQIMLEQPTPELRVEVFERSRVAALAEFKQLAFACHPDRFDQARDKATARFQMLTDSKKTLEVVRASSRPKMVPERHWASGARVRVVTVVQWGSSSWAQAPNGAFWPW